jgi:hypothetical protein
MNSHTFPNGKNTSSLVASLWTRTLRPSYADRMFCRHIPALFVVLLASVVAATAASKPKLKVADDGFPTGQTTPEGAATDLVRAFMYSDVILLQKICIRPYGAGQPRSDYSAYLTNLAAHLAHQKERGAASPDSPSSIARVFAARHLSNSGPASYGYATFDFQDVMFVDVDVLLGSGQRHLRRTLVIKDRDGRWYVHPVPDLSPLLSDGLFDEDPSVQLFSDVYTVEK